MINLARRESKAPLLKPGERNGKPVQAKSRHLKAPRYEVLKDKIRTWWNDRLKIGEALAEIRDEKLYKAEYSTFEEFCTDEFGLKHSQAYGLIAAVAVKESLKPSAMADKITNERQARALAAVPQEKRVEVLTEAAKAPGPVTAKRITAAAKSNGHVAKVEPPKPAARLDKTGYAIPETILEDWDRAEETARRMLSAVSSLRSELKNAKDENDPIFAEVTNSTIADLNNAYTSFKCVVPYAVCTSCQGRAPKKCSLCRGRGFMSEFAWRSYVPAEAKAMREAVSKKK